MEYRRIGGDKALPCSTVLRNHHVPRGQTRNRVAVELVHHTVVTPLLKTQGHQGSRIQRLQSDQTGVAVYAKTRREAPCPVMEGVVLSNHTHTHMQPRCRYHPAVFVKHHARVGPANAVLGVFHYIAQLHHLLSENAVALHQVKEVDSALGVVNHRVGAFGGMQPQQFLGKLVKIQVVGSVHEHAVMHRIHTIAVCVVLVQLYIYLIPAALARSALQVELHSVVVKSVQHHIVRRT